MRKAQNLRLYPIVLPQRQFPILGDGIKPQSKLFTERSSPFRKADKALFLRREAPCAFQPITQGGVLPEMRPQFGVGRQAFVKHHQILGGGIIKQRQISRVVTIDRKCYDGAGPSTADPLFRNDALLRKRRSGQSHRNYNMSLHIGYRLLRSP